MKTNILKSALVSEKSFGQVAKDKFTFLVDNDCIKAEVKEVVEELFKVHVLAINIINIPGKVKRGKKGIGRRSDIKKAVITLKKGEKIDLFEVEEKKTDKTKDKKAKNTEKEISDTTVTVKEKKK